MITSFLLYIYVDLRCSFWIRHNHNACINMLLVVLSLVQASLSTKIKWVLQYIYCRPGSSYSQVHVDNKIQQGQKLKSKKSKIKKKPATSLLLVTVACPLTPQFQFTGTPLTTRILPLLSFFHHQRESKLPEQQKRVISSKKLHF